jgi:hypothetical protein
MLSPAPAVRKTLLLLYQPQTTRHEDPAHNPRHPAAVLRVVAHNSSGNLSASSPIGKASAATSQAPLLSVCLPVSLTLFPQQSHRSVT